MPGAFDILLKGRVTIGLIFFLVFGAIEAFCVLLTSSRGEMNAYGWIAAPLGLIVGAPWTWALFSQGFPRDLWKPFVIGAVVFNAWLIYKYPVWKSEKQPR